MEKFLVDAEYVQSKIPPRRKGSHKGMNGVVCAVGGSRIYHGAPFHCAMGAAKTGVDLVYLAVPSPIVAPIRSLSQDLIVIPLPDSKLTRGNATRLAKWLPEVDCIALGPGLGPQNPDELARALSILGSKTKTLVADADALRPSILTNKKDTKMVVTPHSKEFERLFGKQLAEELDARVSAVSAAAKEHGVVVLLKGPTDVISDGERVALNDVHSPGMTVGGTGDVLTGVTSGLLAKGMGPFEAAACASYINGLAGLEAVKENGLHILASDVVSHIPRAMIQFDRVI